MGSGASGSQGAKLRPIEKKQCRGGKGGRMSWIGGGWDADWNGGGSGEGEAPTTNIPTLTSWLKTRKPIKVSERYKALERDEEEEEEKEQDRKSDHYTDSGDHDNDGGCREASITIVDYPASMEYSCYRCK